ncbi:MAG: VirB3 family type IV secretion system protein [Nevskia sp.]|nr:VirB3 family type IV secretion system protein [Nevskia sp.]
MDVQRTERDGLVIGMTRPLLVWGVTFSYFVVQGMSVTVLFLMGNNLLYLLCIAPLHLVGVLLCKWDARFFDILFRVAQRVRPVRNRPLYRCNVYLPY